MAAPDPQRVVRAVGAVLATGAVFTAGCGWFASRYPADEALSLICAGMALVVVWIGIPAATRVGWSAFAVPVPAVVVVASSGVIFTPDGGAGGRAMIPVGIFFLLILLAVVALAVREARRRAQPPAAVYEPPSWAAGMGPGPGPGLTAPAVGPAVDTDQPAPLDASSPVRFAPLDPFGAHFFVGPGRPLPARPGHAAAPAHPGGSADPATDRLLRDTFVSGLRARGGDTAALAVGVGLFFAGNGDRSSIGPRSGPHPGLAAIRDALFAVERAGGVDELVVEVAPLPSRSLDDLGWPPVTRVRVLTSRPLEDLLGMLAEVRCALPWTDGSVTFADGRPGPEGSRAVSVVWD